MAKGPHRAQTCHPLWGHCILTGALRATLATASGIGVDCPPAHRGED